jgi:hypothetical protein
VDGDFNVSTLFAFPVHWLAGLEDGFVVSGECKAKLYSGGALTDLDLSIALDEGAGE